MTNTPITGDPEQDARFRENLRSQLQEKEAQVHAEQQRAAFKNAMANYEQTMRQFDGFDPYASATLRWLGGIAGVGLLLVGLLWFLSFFGYTIPKNSVFSILFMIVGGAFVVAALTSRKKRTPIGD